VSTSEKKADKQKKIPALQKEVRISKLSRSDYGIVDTVFPQKRSLHEHYRQAQVLAGKITQQRRKKQQESRPVSPSILYAAGLVTLIQYRIIDVYMEQRNPKLFSQCWKHLKKQSDAAEEIVALFDSTFPEGRETRELIRTYGIRKEAPTLLSDLFILMMTQKNPAMLQEFPDLFDETQLRSQKGYDALKQELETFLTKQDSMPGTELSLPDFLMQPILRSPNDLAGQLKFIMNSWGSYVTDLIDEILRAVDFIQEEHRPVFPPGPGPVEELTYDAFDAEYEQFSEDSDWMPRVVMLAKSTLVWLDQLSKQYGYDVKRLDQIPDRELDIIAERGFTSLWLIGLWERSPASKRIKHLCGNPEAEASAYSLRSYTIADSLGGWASLHNLKERCRQRGIRLASDMVPNHTGLDSDWMISRPDLFLQIPEAPYPSYSFSGEDLCGDPNIGVFIEDHYYDRTDAAVTFKRVDYRTGETRHIYHGNDGTSMPWNDTAQLDYLNPETREAVIQTILHVARNFSVIRFDAAMTLAKRHIQRLWYPKPGHGGDIPSRAAYGLSDQAFHRAIPNEFWREVVDRVAEEVPDTLLLAEAFWMMEGYFVRTLGMHRVYNSAFMNMLKNEDDQKYRNTIKNTLSYEPEILKRFVNFMNNPDEDTAIAQFGDGDKYFGVFTMLITMPGLPMVGHGQIEGFREKYGMEYTKAYWDEHPNQYLVQEHGRRIFPIMKLRYLFAEVENFRLYDFTTHAGINEHVYAYTNGRGHIRSLILYNNSYESTAGWISESAPFLMKDGDARVHQTESIGGALKLTDGSGYYCLFEGFHDKLTYIRPSWELYDQGLYAELQGYQTQLFLNFREVYDAQGIFHELSIKLKGQGCSNLERELALIRLQPIHKALEPFTEPDQMVLAKQLFEGNRSVSDICKQRWLPYYRSFINIWNRELKTEGTSLPPQISKNSLRVFLKLLDRFETIAEEIAQASHADTERTADAAEEPSQLQQYLAEVFSVMSEYPVVLYAALLISPLAESVEGGKYTDWVHELLLDDLFDEILKQNGVSAEEAARTMKGAEFISRFENWYVRGRSRGLESNQILGELFSDSCFRSFTGTNWSDGVEWFHKESFQESLVWLAFTQLFTIDDWLDGTESPIPQPEDAAKKEIRDRLLSETFETVFSWYRKEPWAQYQVQKLLSP